MRNQGPANLLKFTLDSIPVDTLDQETMRLLRVIADREVLPIEEVISNALDWYIARHEATHDPQHKIIRFPFR